MDERPYLLYVSDDGYYLREDEALAITGGERAPSVVIPVFPRLSFYSGDTLDVDAGVKTRQFSAHSLRETTLPIGYRGIVQMGGRMLSHHETPKE